MGEALGETRLPEKLNSKRTARNKVYSQNLGTEQLVRNGNWHYPNAFRFRYNGAMMKTAAEQVEAWYQQNVKQQRMGSRFIKVDFGSNEPADPVRGSAGIGLETPVLVASITFWNKGDVAALGLHKESKKDLIFDDRVLTPNEDIPALLDHYFQQIAEQR